MQSKSVPHVFVMRIVSCDKCVTGFNSQGSGQSLIFSSSGHCFQVMVGGLAEMLGGDVCAGYNAMRVGP